MLLHALTHSCMQVLVMVTDGWPKLHTSWPQRYTGGLNKRTIDGCWDVAFFGPHSEYVMSGADDGRLYLWNTSTGKVERVYKADQRAVSCFTVHPSMCMLASAGEEAVTIAVAGKSCAT